MEPLWRLLNTKRKDTWWDEGHKAGLRSAAAGRQYPQVKVKLCGWSVHDRCLICLNDIVEEDAPYAGTKKRTARDPVVATAEQIGRAPI